MGNRQRAAIEYMGGTMAELAHVVVGALSPYVGEMVADTCVRATALSIGKSFDTLDAGDVPRLEERVRRLLGPVCPSGTIDRVLADIAREAS